jgi:hypothetical protein
MSVSIMPGCTELTRIPCSPSSTGHAADGELAGRVGHEERRGGEALDRGDVDDRAAARFPHRRDHRAHPEERADLVDPDHPLVVGERRVGDRAEVQDARVVDQHVDAPDAGHGVGPVLLGRDVEVHVLGGVAQLVRQCLAQVVPDVRDVHAGTLRDARAHGRGALATGGAGDQYDLPVQPHMSSSVSGIMTVLSSV